MNQPNQPADRPLDPEKLLRLASVVRALLDEAKSMEQDVAPTDDLAKLLERITSEMSEALPNVLAEELEALNLDEALSDGASAAEIRIAYSGLVGWLQGLFQGLSAAMQVQNLQSQMNALQEGKEPSEEEVRGRYL